jgi:hypothetical protein
VGVGPQLACSKNRAAAKAFTLAGVAVTKVTWPSAGKKLTLLPLFSPPQPTSHKLKPKQRAVSLFFEIDMFKCFITIIISRILSESY